MKAFVITHDCGFAGLAMLAGFAVSAVELPALFELSWPWLLVNAFLFRITLNTLADCFSSWRNATEKRHGANR